MNLKLLDTLFQIEVKSPVDILSQKNPKSKKKKNVKKRALKKEC